MLDEKQRKTNRTQFSSEIGAEEIAINCLDSRCFNAGSTESVKLARFFDKVIERKYFSRDNSTFVDNKRKFTNITSPVTDSSNRYQSPFTSPLINYSNFSSNLAQFIQSPPNEQKSWLSNVSCWKTEINIGKINKKCYRLKMIF